MSDDNGKHFNAMLYDKIFAPDLCDKLFSIITLMNSGHTFLFHKGFAQFEEGGLSEEKPNTVKDISTLASIN